MKISCLCCTFSRPPQRQYLLEEALQSFLIQTYADKELIIVNDCPEQTLEFDHPNVVIVNLPKRCRTLGEKLNLAVAVSTGDHLAVWDDDDISFPMRLETAGKTLDKSGACYYKPFGNWVASSKGFSAAESAVRHNCSLYSRKAFVKLGGYPLISWGVDTAMDRKLKSLAPHATGELQKTEWQYLYRIGVSDLHVSSVGNENDTEASWLQSGRRAIYPGKYELVPKWLYNYTDLATKAARSGLPLYQTPDLEFWT